MMKKKLKKLQKKNRILIWINCILACIILLAAGTLAAYTSLSNAKRTVSTVGSKQFFSSNILTEYDKDTEIQRKAMSFSSDVEENTFIISVCNYSQGDKTKWSTEDINYTLSVELDDLDGNQVTDEAVLSRYKWNNTAFSELSTSSLKATLSGKEAEEDLYTVTVPTEFMKSYRIKVKAVSDISRYSPLGRVITVAEEITTSKWKLNFLNAEMQQNAYELGCINTILSGSEQATLKLKWDAEHVEIDPWFLEDIGLTADSIQTDGVWSYIEFEAGGVDEDNNPRPNQYNVIFYRTKAAHGDDASVETWTDIKGYIELESTTISE